MSVVTLNKLNAAIYANIADLNNNLFQSAGQVSVVAHPDERGHFVLRSKLVNGFAVAIEDDSRVTFVGNVFDTCDVIRGRLPERSDPPDTQYRIKALNPPENYYRSKQP